MAHFFLFVGTLCSSAVIVLSPIAYALIRLGEIHRHLKPLRTWAHWRMVLRIFFLGNGVCVHCDNWRHEHVNDQCLFLSTRYKKQR